jgi:hypothetical protein
VSVRATVRFIGGGTHAELGLQFRLMSAASRQELLRQLSAIRQANSKARAAAASAPPPPVDSAAAAAPASAAAPAAGAPAQDVDGGSHDLDARAPEDATAASGA